MEAMKTVNIPVPLYRELAKERDKYSFSSLAKFILFMLKVVGEIPAEEVRRKAIGKLPREQGLSAVAVPKSLIDKYFEKNRVATWEVLEMYLERFRDKVKEIPLKELIKLKKQVEESFRFNQVE